MRILLVRHAASTWNEEHRWQGWADPPLSESGRAEAHAMAATFNCFHPLKIFSSDLTRASETAAAIASVAGLDVRLEPALRERDIGLWTGLTSAELEARWPGAREAYRRDPTIEIPGAETAASVVRRAMTQLLTVTLMDPAEGLAVAVSHGGLIRCLRMALGAEDRELAPLNGCWLVAAGAHLSLAGDATSLGDPPLQPCG